MKRLFFILIFAWCWPSSAKAQSNPPFKNPSLDSNCYFPQIGVPGEIDTIYGTATDTIGDFIYGSGLGAYIHNLGPKANGAPGSIFIGNSDDVFSIAPTGANFNLHNLHAVAQNLKSDYSALRNGHFHDQAHLDIFDDSKWIIYWADDNGNYDTSRRTQLESNLYGSYGFSRGGFFNPAYITRLTNDSIDDIVVGLGTSDSIISKDSGYLALFRGGTKLVAARVAFEDTSFLIPPPYGYQTGTPTVWESLEGDYRGTNRDDLLISDYYRNLFFYKNDPPFSLRGLVHAIFYDTLWTQPSQWDTNVIRNGQTWLYGSLTMRALRKKQGDNSYDWVVEIPTFDSGNAVYFFRGGPDFGSHRITIDSAAYVITPPKLGFAWPATLIDAGDMTGTGNHVLATGGGDNTVANLTYYLTGQALDNKIDVYYGNALAGQRDTLTANSDSLEDLLLGGPGYDDPEDLANGERDHGTIWLMYGSKQIPVHLNPQFADVSSIPQKDGAGITFAPNPIIKSWSVATIIWPEAEPEAEYSIYDMLGREVDRGTIRLLGGPEEQRIYFRNLPQGTYIYVITGSKHTASAKIVKLSPASTGGSSQPNIIQQMKAARDGVR